VNELQKSISKYAVYFEELRRRLFSLTKMFAIIFAVGFFAAPQVIKFMMKYLNTFKDVTMVTTSPFQLIELSMSFGFFFACIITVPIFIYHLYSFLKPGLLPKERKFFLLSLPLGLGLFLLGFVYSCGMLYLAIELMAQVNIGLGVANYWDIGTFLSQMVLTSALLGILFIFPLVISFLIKLGIMTVDFLKAKRRHAVVIIFIIVSLLPPTDGLSLVLMSAPLVLIYEFTILFNRKSNRRGRQLVT
jgi:sec-independent protein translocase protein TatC